VNPLKVALVLVPLLLPMHWYLLRFEQIQAPAMRAAYVVLLAGCVVATICAAFIRTPWLRVAYALLFAAALAFSYIYQAIVADFMTYDAYVAMLRSRAFIGDAFTQFLPAFLAPALASTVLFLAIAWPPPAPLPRGRRTVAAAVAPAAAVLCVTAIVYARGGDGAIGLPGNITPLSYGLLYGMDVARARQGEREDVALAHAGEPLDYDVVLIIDESIRGDFLDVGGADGVASHLLDGYPAVHSFGLGASATNCSDPSNEILRFGGTRENYAHTTATQPSIFHYARARGLHTVYIDGQRTGGRLQNGMDGYERSVIDEFVQLDDTPVVDRDRRIADLLVEHTRNGRAELILVNKIGAHFPVHDKFPDEFARYQPVLERGRFATVSDTGERSGDLSWERYTNSYRNALLWNVGEFFRVLLAGADFDHAFMIYTSDHGQDFGEKDAGFNLHCSPDPSPYEGLVPMVVLTTTPAWSAATASWATRNFDHTSHYNVFPTLLEVMGYTDPRRQALYGTSLLEPTEDPLTFNYNYHARFGEEPRWRRVETGR
jgi:lipid A ethanolaminephosphotransferase